MKFHGRTQERKLIHKLLKSDSMAVIMIYGRRRVGKSELIKQVLRESDIRSIYYECKQTTEKNNVDCLSELLSEAYGFPKPSFSGIEELLQFLFKKAEEEKLILELDEYPYLRDAVAGLDGIVQSIIDHNRDRSGIKFILCGSFVDTIKSLLDSGNPFYGRMDRVIDLKPMDYYDSALFYPEYSNEDKVRLYSVFGGIP